jgi:DNA primase
MLPEGEDPDSLIRSGGRAAFADELERALPLSRFFVSALAGGRTPATAEDRAALIAEARPLLMSMAPGAMRLQLLRDLAGGEDAPNRSKRCSDCAVVGRAVQLRWAPRHIEVDV